MKAHVKTKHATFEVEGATAKELFTQIAKVQEVFSESQCGMCKGTEIRLAHRTNKQGDEFFEYVCLNRNCRAYLPMSPIKARPGELFPNRKTLPNGKPADRRKNEGDFTPADGWTRWRGKDELTDE